MKQRPITNEQELQQAAMDISHYVANGGELPIMIIVEKGTKLRSLQANAAYWSEIEFFMNEIKALLTKISEETGYTYLETKRVVANELPVEHVEILYARSKEAVHDAMKEICGVPTTTKLGTKKFSKVIETLQCTMTTILGEINAIQRKAS